MCNKVLSLVAGAALLGSMGAADAQPLTLTDAQLDMATAGIGNTGMALTANATNFGISLPGFGAFLPQGSPTGIASVSVVSSMNGSLGILQTNLSTGANSVQQNSVATASGGF